MVKGTTANSGLRKEQKIHCEPDQQTPPISTETSLPQFEVSRLPSGILHRWCFVTECLVFAHFQMYNEMYNAIKDPPTERSRLQELLSRASQFLKIQQVLHKIFTDRLQALGMVFHMNDVDVYFQMALAALYQTKAQTDFHLRQLSDGANCLIFGAIPSFIGVCVHQQLEVPLDITRWFPLFISTWSVRHHYLAKLSTSTPDAAIILDNGFQDFLYNTDFNRFLTDPMVLQTKDFQHIHKLVLQLLKKQIPAEVLKPARKMGGRGIATESTYGIRWPDGSLRDHKNMDVKVYLLKCPHCRFLTRIKQIYLDDQKNPLKIVCETDSPYVDTTKSSISIPLSKDRAFIRFRTHIRECMKANSVEPDSYHKKFFGDYDTQTVGTKGHKSKWFKKSATFVAPGTYI